MLIFWSKKCVRSVIFLAFVSWLKARLTNELKVGAAYHFSRISFGGGQKFVMVEFWFSVRKFNNNYQIFLAYLKIFLRNQITRRSSKWFKTTGFEQKKLVLHLFPLVEKVNLVKNNHQFHMRRSALKFWKKCNKVQKSHCFPWALKSELFKYIFERSGVKKILQKRFFIAIKIILNSDEHLNHLLW